MKGNQPMRRHFHPILLFAGLMAPGGCTLLNQDATISTAHKPEKGPEAAEIKPAPTPRINPMTHVAAGQMLEKQGDFRGAIEQYEKAVAASPKNPLGYNRLGIVYQKTGNLSEAEAMFRRGLQADPRSATIHNNLGFCLLTQKRFPAAQEAFRMALESAPNYARARMNLAIALAQQGRLDESVAEFSKVVPKDVAHVNLAAICSQKGDYAACEKALREALAINPDCVGAKRHLARVTELARSRPSPAPPTQAGPAVTVAGEADEGPSPESP